MLKTFIKRIQPARASGNEPGNEYRYMCDRHGRGTNLRCYSCLTPLCIKCAEYVSGIGYSCAGCRQRKLNGFKRRPIS